jgi:hypothetical protein
MSYSYYKLLNLLLVKHFFNKYHCSLEYLPYLCIEFKNYTTMMEQIMKLSEGNPGAMTCVMGMLTGDIENAVAGITILPKVEELGIKGTDLYVLWSDLCGKDYQRMAELCKNCPNDILKDACSRQDYSGRELVKDYFDTVEG